MTIFFIIVAVVCAILAAAISESQLSILAIPFIGLTVVFGLAAGGSWVNKRDAIYEQLKKDKNVFYIGEELPEGFQYIKIPPLQRHVIEIKDGADAYYYTIKDTNEVNQAN